MTAIADHGLEKENIKPSVSAEKKEVTKNVISIRPTGKLNFFCFPLPDRP